VLDADERIRQSDQRGERTLWASAAVVTLLYTSLIAGHLLLGDPLSQAAQERERQRRGQDAPESISVEIVPEPEAASKTKRWREGEAEQTPTPTPAELPPQPPQMASIAQPEVPEVEEPTEETKEEPRPEGSPMLLDIESLVDAAAADLTQKIDRAFAKKPQKKQREQQAVMAGGGMKVRGTGASGRSDPFTRSVIAALMKTRPGPFALWGNVLVSFQVSETGQLAYVHLLHSSGNTALDQAAIEAIRKARFQRPPPGLTPDERTYIIDYVFGLG
jgi:TonB family protein